LLTSGWLLLAYLNRNPAVIPAGDFMGVDVRIKNHGTVPIQDSHLWTKFRVAAVPLIPPRGTTSLRFDPVSKGDLHFEFKLGNAYHQGDIGYLDHDDGASIVLTVDDKGTLGCELRFENRESAFAILSLPYATPLLTPGSTSPPPLADSSKRDSGNIIVEGPATRADIETFSH
jgi:hypothetical protein